MGKGLKHDSDSTRKEMQQALVVFVQNEGKCQDDVLAMFSKAIFSWNQNPPLTLTILSTATRSP